MENFIPSFRTTSAMQHDSSAVLDEENWKLEAQAVIDDVKAHVRDIRLSEKLPSTNRAIYLNVTTLENSKICVELSAAGFTVVGNEHDVHSNLENEHFETPYSLLDFVSPQYRNSFADSLVDKLNQLSERQ